jgi:hypothetical protein
MRSRWLATLLWLSPCRAGEPGEPLDAGPGRCELVDNHCVHSGDPSTRCFEWTGMTVDPARRCLWNPHKVFHCELIRGPPGLGCGDEFRCVQDRYDGGPAYSFVSSSCIAAPSPAPCDADLAEAIEERWVEPGGLPDCATLDAISTSPPP